MTFLWGKTSRIKLQTVDPDLDRVFSRALELGLIDISIVEGARSKQKQDEYFRAGKSKVRWPNSKHNTTKPGEKAKAVDAAPYINGAISWKKEHCIFLAGIVLAVAEIEGVKIRWGGDWNRNGEVITDQTFQDLAHYELVL